MAFKAGIRGMSLESRDSLLKSGDHFSISKNERSGLLSNKNVLINLQTTSSGMRGIPENEELDMTMTMTNK